VNPYRLALVLAGAAATAAIAFGAYFANGPALIADIERRAEAARDRAGAAGIEISFVTRQGWPTRHPTLSGGDGLDDGVRARAAAAIAAVPGVGGVHWQARGTRSRASEEEIRQARRSRHCQSDVEAVLKARSIRFSEASASIDPASEALLDEVAAALRRCLGSIIAVTGHTNRGGDEGANLALSKARADAVRWALIGRGIPADGLRAAGLGSEKPVEGLDPADPANRRIDFSVIEKVPLQPTPVDTPGAG
jgi:OOP family OmpA-OmpF porin